MVVSLHRAVLVVLLVLGVAHLCASTQSTYDCKMRQLGLDFSQTLQPFRSLVILRQSLDRPIARVRRCLCGFQEKFQEVADALNGAPEAQGCSVKPNPSLLAAAEPRQPVIVTTNDLFVNADSGSDSNPGTMQAPLKTIGKVRGACAICLSMARNRALFNLRFAGRGCFSPVHRCANHLPPRRHVLLDRNCPIDVSGQPTDHSSVQRRRGLASYCSAGVIFCVIAFFSPFLQVWVSGGIPIQPQWKPYVVNSSYWEVFDNQNDVYNLHPIPGKIAVYGQLQSWQACQSACQTNTTYGQCNAWVWHDANQGQYAFQCWFRFDGVWDPTPQSGHISGLWRPGWNVYVADLSSQGVTSVPGLRQDGQRCIRARYPNANPELGFGSTLTANGWVPTTLPRNPAVEVCALWCWCCLSLPSGCLKHYWGCFQFSRAVFVQLPALCCTSAGAPDGAVQKLIR